MWLDLDLGSGYLLYYYSTRVVYLRNKISFSQLPEFLNTVRREKGGRLEQAFFT